MAIEGPNSSQDTCDTPLIWEPLTVGWVKVNEDASFDRAIRAVSLEYIQSYASVLETEMEACLEKFRLTAQWNSQPAIVETGCLALPHF
jgi:hypothetical protein